MILAVLGRTDMAVCCVVTGSIALAGGSGHRAGQYKVTWGGEGVEEEES